MYFIIIHSSNFDDFLYVNIMFDKDTKQGMMYNLYVITSLNLNNDKRPIEQLKKNVQVK